MTNLMVNSAVLRPKACSAWLHHEQQDWLDTFNNMSRQTGRRYTTTKDSDCYYCVSLRQHGGCGWG